MIDDTAKPPRLYLSPPHLFGQEMVDVQQALASNWVAPAGPDLAAFEKEFSEAIGAGHAVALSSGTAALHLAMQLVGVRPGDEVLCSTLTFAASANPIVYEGGRPVFVDAEPGSWGIDPDLVAQELDDAVRRGRRPRAVVVVHLYGQSVDLGPIVRACALHDVPLIEDAAEALGARYGQKSVGTFGRFGMFSFNGNKIITTSGGGMLVSSDRRSIERALYLATQARDPVAHYQHSTIGYNYRLSNVLAALGRAQLRTLGDRITRRRCIFEQYRKQLEQVPGLSFMPEPDYGFATRWLTVALIDPGRFGADREDVRLQLERHDIESRPVWKPLHLQPAFAGCRYVGGTVAEGLFARGLCLPSGSQMTEADVARTIDGILTTPHARRRAATG